jgi:hypothetical protein
MGQRTGATDRQHVARIRSADAREHHGGPRFSDVLDPSVISADDGQVLVRQNVWKIDGSFRRSSWSGDYGVTAA